MLPNEAGDDDPAATSTTVFTAGASIGRYRIEDSIGVGGMGAVFRARDTQLGRAVAIKTSSAPLQARFQIEARAISALNHPHICTLYDAGPNYLVMELVEGQSLAARLRAGPLPRNEALGYAIQIAQALGEAHAHGIVHRDLKPGNIMLTRHGVKVLDFGLARILEETAVTELRTVLGTPAYMAPEQTHGGEPSYATDLFAFGLVLYEMLAGSLPLPGASLGSLLASGAQPRLPPLSEQRSGLPHQLDGLTTQLLAADAALRPASAVEVEHQLSALLEQSSPTHTPDRLRWWARAGAIAFIVLLVAAAWLYRRIEQN
ncbi:MAG: serine/threonine-protein kinase, partial [Terriglobales bacterium]